jgi:hypothetical protein
VWESQDEQVHFQTIGDRMMADESLAGAMLGMYQRVLTDGGVGIDGSAEQIALRLTGAVVKRGDRISVMNRIYEGVFGSEWVMGKLEALRPYGEEFQNWKISGDEQSLLRGDQLQSALDWAFEENRKLDPEDYKFLKKSQDLEVKDDKLKIQELIQQVEDAVAEKIITTYNVQNINADERLRDAIQEIGEKGESNYRKIERVETMTKATVILSIIAAILGALSAIIGLFPSIETRWTPTSTPTSKPISK